MKQNPERQQDINKQRNYGLNRGKLNSDMSWVKARSEPKQTLKTKQGKSFVLNLKVHRKQAISSSPELKQSLFTNIFVTDHYKGQCG